MSTDLECARYDAGLYPHLYEPQRLAEDGCAFCGKHEGHPVHSRLLKVLAESELQERRGSGK